MWLKYAHSSVDIGNHRYTNEQNYIRGNISVIKKKLPPPLPQSQKRPYSLATGGECSLISPTLVC